MNSIPELNDKFYRALAVGSRADLVAQIETITEEARKLRSELCAADLELVSLKNRKTVIIAGDHNNADIALRRMKLSPYSKDVIVVTTGNRSSLRRLDGISKEQLDIFLVPGWSYLGDRLFEDMLADKLAALQINIDSLPYAPGPEFDRLEQDDDRYGRVTARKYDELLSEVLKLRNQVASYKNEPTETHESSPIWGDDPTPIQQARRSGGVARWLDSND